MEKPKRKKMCSFNPSWEQEYGFVMVKKKCVCLICNKSVSVPKKDKVSRHYITVHSKFSTDYPAGSELRKKKIDELRSGLDFQQKLFINPNSALATEASLRISFLIAKSKRPFEEGNLIKESFVAAAQVLYAQFPNKDKILRSIHDLQLSRATVTRRVESLAENCKDQLRKDIERCRFFSIQLDESTDVIHTSQLSIFIRMTFEDYIAKEELLTIIPLKGQTRGVDVLNIFKEFVKDSNLPLGKLAAITTDGAPSMVGSKWGFVSLCRQDSAFPPLQAYHCIIHQQSLCSKVIAIKAVMKVVVQIVNSIRAQALQRRLFRALVEELDDQYGELLLYTEVRWLSRGKCLQRFRELLPSIEKFLEKRGDEYAELCDNEWLLDLAFLVDMTAKLNELNLKLQGKEKKLSDMLSAVMVFEEMLTMIRVQISKRDFKHFPTLEEELVSQKLSKENFQFNIKYADMLQIIEDAFRRRFQEFRSLEQIVMFLEYPFIPNNIEDIAKNMSIKFGHESSALELEILGIRKNIILKTKSSEENFWKFVSAEDYPLLKEISLRVLSFFPSTYLSESAFSNMKTIKSKLRGNLSDAHLDDSLRLAVTHYVPLYSKLVADRKCKPSN